MAKIKAIDNFLINSVKEIREKLEIGQEELSEEVYGSEGSNIVGTVESEKPVGYNDHHLNAFANYFSAVARSLDEYIRQERGLNENYEITDFYPEKPMADELIDKKINKVSLDSYPSGALKLLAKEQDEFVKFWRSIKEITDYCNSRFNKEWGSNEFSGALAYAEKIGLFAREGENSPRYKLAD